MKFELYKDTVGQWRWRFKASNGEIFATSGGDGYHNKSDAIDAIHLVQSAASTAPVVQVDS